MRHAIAVAAVLAAAGCGKELNPEFCDAHPADDRCLGGSAIDAARDAVADSPALQCPSAYDVTLGGSTSKYRIVDATSSWTSAEADCADDGASGSAHTHLVVLSDEAERLALQPHMDRDRHVGHSDAIAELTWLAVTDEPDVYPALVARSAPPWAVGEPNDSGDCAVMTSGLELRDRDCTFDIQAYACECDVYLEDPSNF